MEYKLGSKGFNTLVMVVDQATKIGPIEITEKMAKKNAITVMTGKTQEEVTYIVVGCKGANTADFEILGGNVMTKIDEKRSIYFHFASALEDEQLKQFIIGLELGAYEFDKYKKEKVEKGLSELYFHPQTPNFEKVLDEALVYADSTNFARELVNEPANKLNPESYERIIMHRYKDNPNVKVTVYKGESLLENQMNGLHTVGKASQYEPRLISLEYKKDPSKEMIALVGKGLTFDSGGMNVKTMRYVGGMRNDMGGSAATIGAFDILVNLEADVNVVCNLSICENAIDERMMMAGDIIHYPNGLTVEVGNTDAEGRLVLADSLILSQKQGAKHIVDAATLTGAIVAALGDEYAGLFGNNELAIHEMIEAGKAHSEKYWHMPMAREYIKYIKSDTADYMNIALTAPGAGSSTAAIFLELFIEEGTKWLHLDIAGTAFTGNIDYKTKATGFGARSIAQYVLNHSK